MGDEDASDALAEHMTSATADGVVNYVGQQIEGGAAGDLDERRKMTQAWADYLDGLRTGANVVPFRRPS